VTFDGEDRIDALLREVMTSADVPSLSREFDQRLEQHLSKQRLSSKGRAGVTVYSFTAAALSVWALRHAAFEWPLVAAALASPVAIAAAAYGRYLTPFARR
jgi:hypothetical protein